MTQDGLEAIIRQKIAELLGRPLSQVPGDVEFASLGLDSVQAVTLTAELEDLLGVSLDPSLVFEYPSARALAAYLASYSRF